MSDGRAGELMDADKAPSPSWIKDNMTLIVMDGNDGVEYTSITESDPYLIENVWCVDIRYEVSRQRDTVQCAKCIDLQKRGRASHVLNTSNNAASSRLVSPAQAARVKRERSDDEDEETRRVSQRTNQEEANDAARKATTMDEFVLEIMQSEDENVLKETLEKINALLYDKKADKVLEKAQNDFFQLGGHLALVCIMKKHLECLEIQKIGISILLCEGRGESDDINQAIGRVGGMQAILAAMKAHPNDDHIVYYATKALYNLICSEANAKLFVLSTDGVSVILESMKTFAADGETLYEACDLLHSLCEYKQLRDKLVDFKTASALITAYENNKGKSKIRKKVKAAITLLFK